MKTLRASEYDYSELTDFTDEDMYLIQHPKENPFETEKSRNKFSILTGSQTSSSLVEKVLEDCVSKELAEKFQVNQGWKILTVWRFLNISIEEIEKIVKGSAQEPIDEILILDYLNLIKEKFPSINCFPSENDLLGKAVYVASKLDRGYIKGKKRIEAKLQSDVLEEFTVSLAKSIRAFKEKELLISYKESIVEEFLSE